MSNPDHLAKLLQGQDAWNAWREDNPDIVPDLSRAALTERAGIPRAILSGGLDLRGALLLDADLSGASLREADLTYACLEGADLRQADLSRAALAQADLSDSDLMGARLANADLAGASLSRARLGGADLALAVGLTNAQVGAAYCDIETQLPTYLDAADIYKDPDAEAELDIEDDPAEESFAADEAEDDAPEADEAPERKRALNPYKVLEVTPLATALELRNAYLRLAKKYHPDVNPGDAEAEQRFKDINEAYRRAAARSRKKHEAKRGHSVRFWAAAAAFFLVGAVAASVAVHMISVPRSADLHARSAPEAAPGEAQTVASDRVRDEADELEEKTEAGAKEETEARSEIEVMSPDEGPAASRAAAPIAMSISTAKDDSARAVPEPTSSPVPVAIEEHASLANEPSQPPAASAPPAAPAAVAANEIPVPDPGQPPVVPSPPERETPVESIEPATVTADIRPEPSVPASESPAPEEAAVDEKPATVPPPQRMARLTEEEDKGEDKEAEFKAWQSTKEAGTLAAFRAYLINFPNGRHVGDAHKHLAALELEIAGRKEDEAAWSKAQRLSTRTALVGYLLAYPDGRNASEAKKKLSALDAKTASLHKEDEAWARARANNSHKAYADYLSAYPKGRYAAQAQETIAAVQSRPQSAAPSPPPIVGASRVDQAADDGQSRRSPRFPSSDEPFIERLPGPH